MNSLFLLFIPFIPLIACLLIGGGIITLIWYSNLSTSQQEEANRRALRYFGRRFKELTEDQQKRIKDELEQDDN